MQPTAPQRRVMLAACAMLALLRLAARGRPAAALRVVTSQLEKCAHAGRQHAARLQGAMKDTKADGSHVAILKRYRLG